MIHRKPRKRVTPSQHTHFKHLRFVDLSEGNGKVMSHGGYTLSYRCLQGADKSKLEIVYAYAECNLVDNFCRTEGTNRSYHRLQGKAPEFYAAFEIDATNLDTTFVQAHNTEGVDIVNVFDAQRVCEVVVRHFLDNWSRFLTIGCDLEGEGALINNLIVHNGQIALNGFVIDYDSDEDSDEDDIDFATYMRPASALVLRAVNENLTLIHTLDAIDPAEVTREDLMRLIETFRTTSTDMQKLLIENGADINYDGSASDDDDEDEEGRHESTEDVIDGEDSNFEDDEHAEDGDDEDEEKA